MNSCIAHMTSGSPLQVGESLGLLRTASSEVKRVAGLFIKTLETEQCPSLRSTPRSGEFVSQEARQTLTGLLTPEVANELMQGVLPERTPFYEIGRGKNNIVWGHPTYPDFAIKLMESEAAQNQLQVGGAAFEATQEMKNCWIQIPRAESLEVGEITAYIEERLPIGFDLYQHSEFWARILIHYQSPNCSELFKGHLSALVSQIQLLVEQMGFWDVGYHNLPEVRSDGKGVCGIDFDNVNLDNNHVLKGLERIACMFAVLPLAIPVIESYEKELQRAFESDLDILEMKTQEFHLRWERQSEGIKALQDAIKHYDEKGYVKGKEEILCCCDFADLDESEKQLAQHVLKNIIDTLSKVDNQKKTLSEMRSFNLKVETFAKLDYTHERFLKVLDVLKKQNVVISWSDNYKLLSETGGNLESVSYGIYF